LYLGHHFGKKQYLVDSAKLNEKSEVVFSGKEKLFGGVYMVVYPRKNGWFEILVDKQQRFSVVFDTLTKVKNIGFINSPDNVLFKDYQNYSLEKGTAITSLQKKLGEAKNKADSIEIRNQIINSNDDLQKYRENFIKQNPNHILTAIFQLLKDPVIPPAEKHPGGKYDSAYAYQYYKSHYWDGVSFTDERLVRTPVFQPRLERYFGEILQQSPDTLIREVDKMLEASKSNKEMFKFLLSTFTDRYVNPTYMGQDAVFVHLFQKYYATGQADYWMNEKYKKFIFDRGYSLMANLLGDKAANMELLDTSGKKTALYKVESPYTVVCFWDPTCSHCKVEVPKVDSLFQQKWKRNGITLFGVMTDGGKEAWLKYIREHNLKDWIHVYQTQEMRDADYAAGKPGFRQLYDVYQTPMLYLLDKDKRIVAKKLNYQQLDDFLEFKMKTTRTN
jgi:peroxiredoxin